MPRFGPHREVRAGHAEPSVQVPPLISRFLASLRGYCALGEIQKRRWNYWASLVSEAKFDARSRKDGINGMGVRSQNFNLNTRVPRFKI